MQRYPYLSWSLGMIFLSAIALLEWALPMPLVAEVSSSDQAIQYAQRRVLRKPNDPSSYYRLGDAYIQKARETGDVTYFTLAEKALRKSLTLAPAYSAALRHLAYVLYSKHEFQEAAVQAEKSLALDPSDSHVYGVLGDAYLEVGKYDQAAEVYRKMIGLQGDLYSYSRLSGLKNLQGNPNGAMEDLKQAITLGKANMQPAESLAWAQWQLGNEHFMLGNLQPAAAHYRESLITYPNYHRALAGMAMVSAAEKKYSEAIDLYKKAIAIIPLPEYAAALGDVYTKLGRHGEANKQYDLVEYIGYLNSLNKVLYNRELGYFYADHDRKLDVSLDLAMKEIAIRKDIYAYDLLSWAFYKNGRYMEALAASTEALKLGTQDARLFFHAGMIQYRLGKTDRAEQYLRQALATNPYFHIFFADVAKRTLEEMRAQAVHRVPSKG